MMYKFFLAGLVTSFLAAHTADAQVSARMFRMPDVSKTHIVFAYGGDIWIVDKNGGTASKLSSPSGAEAFPRFSPDGSMVAFSGNYDGNTDVYVMPSLGGLPTRLTYHGMPEDLIDWYPDGKHILYNSSRESGKQRFGQFYKVPVTGGLAEKLPIAYGEFGSLSPDGSKIVFNERSVLFDSWKRYRGGSNGNLWLFDLKTLESKNITNTDASCELPMWHGDRIYYMSDRGDEIRDNIWMYDLKTGQNTQVTHFADDDIHFPSIGPDEIVFEYNGQMHLLDLKTHATRTVNINVLTDLASIKPRKQEVSGYITNLNISPDGNRALVEARGEVFSLPAEEGVIQNLTNTPGVAERYPAWSPDGKYVAYWSDKSGEYELTIRDLTKGAEEKKLTSMGPGFRYNIYWAPDSKKLVFIDQTMTFHLYNVEKGTVDHIDQDYYLFEGGLRGWTPSWSGDSQWLAYEKSQDNRNPAVYLYNVNTKAITKVTSGFYATGNPTFDPDGKYLYVHTNQSLNPVYSDFDNTWVYPNSTQLAAIPLTVAEKSPLAVKNDTVAIAKVDEPKKEEAAEPEKGKSSKKDDGKKEKDADATADTDKKDEKKKETKIDLDGFEQRMVILPVKSGNVGDLSAVSGKLVYMRYPNSGSEGGEPALMYYDLEKREEKKIMEGVNGYVVSAAGKKVLVIKGGQRGIVKLEPDQKLEKTLGVGDMEATIDPLAEWTQIYNDAWRFERDFFYDKDMHGVDWEAVRKQYAALLPYCVSRADINFVLGEMIGELNASHTYRYGGDQEQGKRRAVGYLGIDWA